MPFRSEAQRRWMWSQQPAMAKNWSAESHGDINVIVDASDMQKFNMRLRLRSKTALRNERLAAEAMAGDLVEAVRTHASGRPGPQVVTGAYRNSIRILEQEAGGDGSTFIVGTDAPQAARLEFGFVGVDALGRHYHQPPFPHWRPALREIEDQRGKYKNMLTEGM